MRMKKNALLLLFIAIKMVLQFVVVNPIYELQRDEYLHLDQAKHLAWGYHSVPPFTSWVSWLILQLGNSYFWIKFFPALFGALTIWVVWKAIESLKGGLFACVLAAISIIFSAYLRLNLLYQPNSFDILAWTLIYYALVRFIQTENYKWLYLLAFSFALGFLNKYNIIFCLAGLLPALLLSSHRKYFLKPQLYGAALLALLLIAPNLIWQYQHHFPVFKHLKELNDTQLVNVDRMDFVADQLKFFIGSLPILIAAFIGFFAYPQFKRYRFLFWSYVFTIAIFIFLRAKGYYALGLYPILLAFGSAYLGNVLAQGWKFYFRYVVVAVVLLFFVPVLFYALPLKTPDKYADDARQHKPFSEHKWEDGKIYPISQDFADMLGWKELARKVDYVYRLLPDQQHTLILCNNYGQAGAINYYTQIKRLKADSFNADYINWIDLTKPISTLIRVVERNADLRIEHSLFNNVVVLDEIKSPYAREKGTQIILLTEPKTDINQVLKQAIAQRKE